jgi:hypothetical protein
MLTDASGGIVSLLGPKYGEAMVTLREAIGMGHKIALRPIQQGEMVVKYGVIIGEATQSIFEGQWVHLHNCRSRVDMRSANLDRQTGLSAEVPYV